jgi:hypothetical protein
MPVLDVEVDAVRDLFKINYFAQLSIAQAFVPLLIMVRNVYNSIVLKLLNCVL